MKIPTEAKEVATLVIKAQELAITDPKGMEEATVFLSNLNKANDKITKEKEKVTKPLNAALKAERERWKPIETKLSDAIALVRRAMTTYQTKAVAEQRAQEDKIVNRVGEGKGKFTTETAVRKIEEIAVPEETVATEQGSVQFRSVQKFEIMDFTLLTDEYKLADETKIREAMKRGTVVPGVRYYEEQVPYNTR
jgi:hypothetical protein